MVSQLAVLSTSQFVVNAGFGVIIPVLPIFSAELGLGASGVGVLLSAPSLARVALNLPFGKLADSIGRKPLMIYGT